MCKIVPVAPTHSTLGCEIRAGSKSSVTDKIWVFRASMKRLKISSSFQASNDVVAPSSSQWESTSVVSSSSPEVESTSICEPMFVDPTSVCERKVGQQLYIDLITALPPSSGYCLTFFSWYLSWWIHRFHRLVHFCYVSCRIVIFVGSRNDWGQCLNGSCWNVLVHYDVFSVLNWTCCIVCEVWQRLYCCMNRLSFGTYLETCLS